MTPLEQLKNIQHEKYTTEEGDVYQLELKPGLTDAQIDAFAAKLPGGKIPEDIRELLKYTSGFAVNSLLEEVIFTGTDEFGFEEFFPYTVSLAGDGLGNFWVVSIDENGHWGNIYFVCHDPAVIVKHSDNLAQFLFHIDESGKRGDKSHHDIVHEKTVWKIWREEPGLTDKATAINSEDETLRQFAASLPDNYFIADLRNKPIGAGFAWGKFGADLGTARVHNHEPIWGVEKKVKKGLFSKLFG
ncbi:MAG TPA: SMI1/KNR4 family protein [Ohtaekwangia sp.]|uniref:SMI1/KNR4 family protein n=1 Tax=Ohtaekwangia sp. TaxID=2066019 RepID=UPI002F92D1AE